MKAFFNNEELKQERINRVIKHRELDNLVKGASGDEGKGCAVWCTLNKYDHQAYETEMGIPEWLARLEDTLFENMPDKRSQAWPEEFLKAINLGADLEQVKTPFIIFVLEQNLKYLDQCKFDAKKYPDVQNAIEGSRSAVTQMIFCHKNGLDLTAALSAAESSWSAAAAAESVAWSAEAAVESARSAASAWSVESAEAAVESARSAAVWSVETAAAEAAAGSARSAAWSAARSAAWSVAWSAEAAARAATRSAASALAAAAESSWSAAALSAQTAAFESYADKLLELLRECKKQPEGV